MSNKPIPTYSLDNFPKEDAGLQDVFLLNQKIRKHPSSVNVPFRSNYFGIGLCLNGQAELKANLETYFINKDDLIMLSPEIIKQWTYMSEEFETLTIFFTEAFISKGASFNVYKFPFFETVARHVLKLSTAQAQIVFDSLSFIQKKYDQENAFRTEILQQAIGVLLQETNSFYQIEVNAAVVNQGRAQGLTLAFKKLVFEHFAAQRSLKFYAARLFVTSKHLSETVREMTGKTAGAWIDETVILEACILLQDSTKTISQISDLLQFPDQSTFGRYFKNHTGTAPLVYRQSL